MKSLKVIAALLLLSTMSQAQDNTLRSHAELTNYEETSRYDDVLRFFDELQKRSPLVRVETFGHSVEGRALPLVILSDPPISEPRDARASGKPIVFVFANIHAGEVEGKEAMQHMARRIVLGDMRSLLDKLIILIAPIYNADGNEKINVMNRTAQNGPLGGVGVRENAKGLDLNRDYMKLESPEAQSLVRLFNRWDPHLTVDLHTTNGSYHGYHLTYSIPLNPTIDPRIIAYHREKMMPAIAKAMLAQHKFRTYYYGNFEGEAPKPGAPDKRRWEAFTHQPRIGQNYVGFRNRLTILSEAYSYLDFRRRVEVTEAFVEEILKYSAAHGAEMSQLANQVDLETIRRGLAGPPFQMGVEYEMKPLPKSVVILVGEVTKVKNPRSGRDMTVMLEDKFTKVLMQDYGLFAAKRSVTTARAYVFRREDGTRAVIDKLLQHGIAVEELTAPLTTEVESFVIDSVKKAGRPFQGHTAVTLTGKYKKETLTFPAGSILVRAAQPLGTLAAYLLEPESDDGLTSWNFLDAYLGEGKVHPIYKMMGEFKATGRVLFQ
ncbi:MAG TPA: M14 family metallopeptidase [Blastocatellia bacterium]|nr:M14 family metallopeptidase [Blastocatellia bacterium]